jgi:hypothetical protein
MTPTAFHKRISWCLVLLAAVVIVYGLFTAPERAWPNLLLDVFYIVSLGVSAIFFLATQRLTGARWSASLRRIPEALMLVLPAVAGLMLLLYFGRHELFPWSQPGIFDHEPAIAGRVRYLQTPWVFGRMAVVLLVWSGFALLLRRFSLQQDRHPELSLLLHRRLTRLSIVFVIVFAISFTVGAYDWLISLDPHWFSTMFAVYIFAGTFVQGIAAVTLGAVTLRENGVMNGDISEHQLHDLGKMLFAFSTFWAYIWTCQYLLIWYGNIPEEVTHYVSRTRGPWLYLFAANLVVNWIVPFLVLISKAAKCNVRTLRRMSILVLCGHWLDLYLVIMPARWSTPHFGLFELPMAAGFAALAYLIVVRVMKQAPLVPVNDPVLAYERMHHVHS